MSLGALGHVYGLGQIDPYGGSEMDYAGGGGFDWDAYIRQGIDITGAVLTKQPYYVYNPNVATSRTETTFPVYDPASGRMQERPYPVQPGSREIAASASRTGIGVNVPYWALVGGGLLFAAFAFGRRR